MRNCRHLPVNIAVAVFLSCSSPVFAQTGTLIVEVSDESGPLPAATVTVSHPTGYRLELLTNVKGLVEFRSLRPVGADDEPFAVSVEFPAYETQLFKLTRLMPGDTVRLPVTLEEPNQVKVIPGKTVFWCDDVVALVVRVIDGDTLLVADLNGAEERVRLIGVKTPETVHPQKPVEYFGMEASEFTQRMAEGKIVCLESEQGVSDRDRSGRLLRYVYFSDWRLLNSEIIAQGYGFAYTRFPFSKLEEFRAIEREARAIGRGLWADHEEKPE